jgi:hypothetical protein
MRLPLKIAWSVFLVFHLLMMTVSMAKSGRDTPVVGDFFRAVKPFTEPYQWTFGLHQNWPMFAPNPRLSTSWLEVTGKLASDGTYVPVAMPHGTPDPRGHILLYDRSGKLERNASSREHLRAAFVRWACRTHPEPLQAVKFVKATQTTPPPGSDPGPREMWRVRRSPLEEWRCKGY